MGVIKKIATGAWLVLLVSCNNNPARKGTSSDLLINNLMASDTAIRYKAIRFLEELEPGADRQVAFMQAAAMDSFPPAEYEWQTIPSLLVEAATKKENPLLPQVISDVFPKLDAVSKTRALAYLTTYPNKESVTTFVRLFLKFHSEVTQFPAGGLSKSSKEINSIVFPSLLQLAGDEVHGADIVLLLLENFENDKLEPGSFESYKDTLVTASTAIREQLATARKKITSIDKIWDDDSYLELRRRSGIYEDILGYFKGATVVAELTQYLSVEDANVKKFAAVSLLRLGQTVEKKYIDEIAADPESRNYLYKTLVEFNKEKLFPPVYSTQAAFAEGVMVEWLLYPTELARKPDEIQLMKVVEVDEGPPDGLVEFYLYRFRSNDSTWKKDGWMTGVAGYFKKGVLSTEATGYTFSSFEKWESKTPEQHVADIRKLITESNKKNNKEN